MFLVAVIVVALVGGFVPAVLAAIVGSLLLNYYFTPPIHQWTIAQANNALALGVFVAVATAGQLGGRHRGPAHQAGGAGQRGIGAARHHGRQRAARPARAQRAARPDTGSVRHGVGHAARVHARQRPTEGQGGQGGQQPPDARRTGSGSMSGSWHVVASRGEPAVTRPDEADVEVPVAATLSLALRGRPLPASDRRVLGAFALLRGGRPRPAAAGRRGRGGQAHRGRRPDADRAARRGQPRPAHAAGVGQGGRDQPAISRRGLGRRKTTTSCWPRRTSRLTGSPTWWTTCWT